MKYDRRTVNRLINKIEKYFGIKVKQKKTGWWHSGCNCWAPGHQDIYIGMRAEYWYEVIGALAHEFGHCQSVLKKKNIKMGTYMLYKLCALYTEQQRQDIIAEERRAWRYGFKLMRDLGIEVDDRLLKFRDKLIRGHIKRVNSMNAAVK